MKSVPYLVFLPLQKCFPVHHFELCIFTPPPYSIGDGVLFSFDFFVSLSARLRANDWTDLHEIFREGVE